LVEEGVVVVFGVWRERVDDEAAEAGGEGADVGPCRGVEEGRWSGAGNAEVDEAVKRRY
jgi:hypothetical protein